MPSKQVEDVYEAQKREAKRQELSPKLEGYGEGVLHGYAEAQKQISDLTGGAITLNPPRAITEWRERLKRAGKRV